MALVKALIQPLDENMYPKGVPVPVQFNPSEYTIEKSNQFLQTTIPGLSVPVTHFISGNSQVLTMDLFFDTYETGVDVRVLTRLLTGLLDVESDLHAPPVVKFIYGSMVFKAVIERISQKFTMFLETGIPVRSTMNVTFKEYMTIKEQFKNIPRNSSDRSKSYIIKQGDSLWQIAAREYGDPGHWRHIAKLNKISNPRKLETGKEILIPPLE